MIGTRAIEKHFNSLLGRPLFAFLRLLGPERTLMRMKQNLRSANNFCESELFVVAPEHFHLWFNDSTLVKHIRVGLMRRGLELLYSSSWSVNIISSDELGTVYEIKAH